MIRWLASLLVLFSVNEIPRAVNETGRITIDCAFRVHRALGPGLLEACYKKCMAYELKKVGQSFEMEKQIPILYDGHVISSALRVDLWIEQKVIVELKAVSEILPIHEAQLMTYLRLTGCRLGLLLNFNVKLLKNGITRIAL